MNQAQRIAIMTFLAFIGLGAVTKINQAPKQHTKAPGEPSCGSCHGGAINTGPGTVSLGLPLTGYVPGQTYTLTHAVSDATFTNGRFGFSTTSLNGSNAPAGTFAILTASNTSLQTANVSGNIRQYLGHANATGTTSSWDYQWTAPATDVGSITFYTVSVAANGNSSTSGDNVYEESFVLNAVLPPTAGFEAVGLPCLESPIVFTDTSSGIIDTYQWNFGPHASVSSASSPGPHTVFFDTLGPQTVQLIVSGGGGADTLAVIYQINPLPVVLAGPDSSFCEGNVVQLTSSLQSGSAPFAYTWACGPGILNPNDPAPVVSPADTTFYCVQVSDAQGCLSKPDSIQLNVLAAPKAQAGPDLILCQGEMAFLQGGLAVGNEAPGPYGFVWTPTNGLNSPLVPNPQVTPDSTTSYQLEVSAGNGCSSFTLPGDSSAMMTVFLIDTIGVELGPDLSICQGDTIELSSTLIGTPTASFAWTASGNAYISDTSAANPRVSAQANAIYQLIVSSPGACANDTAMVAITVSPFPTVPSISFANDTLLATGAGNYQWYYYDEPSGDTIEVFGATDSIFPYDPYYHLATATGVIILASTNEAGCTTYTETYTLPFPTNVITVIDPWFGQNIYPNPMQNKLGIEFSYRTKEATVIWITDLEGRRIRTLGYSPSEFERDEIDLSELSAGLYLIHFFHGQERATEKFLKQ